MEAKRNIFRRILIRFLHYLAGTFPLNAVRVSALRCCGYTIGRKVYVGPGLFIATRAGDPNCGLTIGDRVSIGPRVILVLASDANDAEVGRQFPPVRAEIHIGQDSWLGAGVIVMPGVGIGDRAVIGAGAVVTRNVHSNTMAAGVPAKAIRTIEEK